MSLRVARNVVWNWSGMAVTTVTGFIVAPVLVHRLGDSAYGLWILIASLSGYFGLLDLGVRGSVGRYIAYYLAQGDQKKVNATLSTAVTILSGVAAIVVAATMLVLLAFFQLFDVPPGEVAAAKLAIVIIGINLALTFPVSVFDGVLWGHERFDLLNAADIPVVLLRTVLTIWLVQGPGDIVTLAWITLFTTIGNEVAKVGLSFWVDPQLWVSPRLFDRAAAVQLYGYGFWQFLLQIARQISGQLGPLVIGGIISTAAVTPYSIASRLITYLSQFIVAATGVLTPLATAMDARSDRDGEKQLYIEGGKWCTSVAMLAGVGMILLGGSLLELWMGERFVPAAYPMLVALTVGELLPMSQWLTYSILMGKARHRAMATASVAEAILAGLAGAWAAQHYGALGVCIVFGATGLILRGVFQLVYGARVLEVSLDRYITGALLPALGAAAVPATLLWAAVIWHQPASWLELIGYAAAFGTLHALSAVWLLGGAKLVIRRWSKSPDDAAVAAGVVEEAHG